MGTKLTTLCQRRYFQQQQMQQTSKGQHIEKEIQEQPRVVHLTIEDYSDILNQICHQNLDSIPPPQTKIDVTNPSPSKMRRIMNEQKLFQKDLPVYPTNAIFTRCSSQDMNHSRVIISGTADTPYAYGLFLFDLIYTDTFPQTPPSMKLITTGGNTLRFNPNLYSNGYVCLSLLGTWKGSVEESWNPSTTNILHILMSIQSLVMNNDVLFCEPAYNGTSSRNNPIYIQMNRGYTNIVRYGVVKYAINDMLNQDYPDFKELIDIHFYFQKDNILKTVAQWVNEAEAQDFKEVCYEGLVNSHNKILSEKFRQNVSQYLTSLKEEFEILKDLLSKLTYEDINQYECVSNLHKNKNGGKAYQQQISIYQEESKQYRENRYFKKLKKKKRISVW